MVNCRCFILNKNRVRPDSQLFNSWGCNSRGRGWGFPLPSRLWGLVERRKLPQWCPGWSPGRKTSFGVSTAWKNTPDFTSPDFFHFPWPLWNSDFSRFSRWVVTLSRGWSPSPAKLHPDSQIISIHVYTQLHYYHTIKRLCTRWTKSLHRRQYHSQQTRISVRMWCNSLQEFINS